MKIIAFLLAAALFLNGCCCHTMCRKDAPLASLRRHREIREFTGAEAFHNIRGIDRRNCYMLHYAQLFANYGENVEFQMTRQMIVLDDSNRELLYGPESVPVPRYRKGSRPVLEAFVAGVRDGAACEQDVALNIMRRTRDLYKQDPVKDRQWTEWTFGGTEEELIARGELLCEVMGRLFVALCEIEGIPARRVAHIVGGHYTAEAFVDGHWMYCDPRFGMYFLKEDGRCASLAELFDDPGIIDRQGDAVKADIVDYSDWETRAHGRCRDIYLTPVEINGFEYYSLADADKYSYGIVQYGEIEHDLMLYNKPYTDHIQKLKDSLEK